ncbi:hypothetical protein MS3_00001708 [Schistosoma haematobium]|uniref:Uncharacterized protein n=1 Tax=Schistosoma haematobium TaxID=6185 RepID=A0A922LX56_SCHHA|nr:hypothetical protein MS3_00001708 [Schistosoma haematobium]KAH9595784.1 hypothetical protein MS3_00001708 [Schistosoma haematobium]
MRQLYDTTKKLSEKYSKQKRPAKDKEGKPITEIEEQRNKLVAHFEELTNRPAPLNPPDIEVVHTDLPIDVTTPMTEEIRMAISQIKSGKVVGLESIPVGALKSYTEATSNMFHVPFRKICEEEQVPQTYWKEGYLIKIPKKGDLSKCENTIV